MNPVRMSTQSLCLHCLRSRTKLWPQHARLLRVAGLLALGMVLVAGGSCATAGGGSAGGNGVLQVVAAENFWGSIAAQLGGTHVQVTSIVSDPNADPHEYESSTADARAFAEANYVILNGAGYDTWGQKLLDANPTSGRKVLGVADLLGKKDGDNPHFWYNPDYVTQVANQITKDYRTLDPAHASDFARLNSQFLTVALKSYHDHLAAIKAAFVGRTVGATEDIFVYLANALGLTLISPPAFMQAVAEGNDPPVSAVAAFQQQIQQRQITVLVYNVQTSTAVTTNLKQQATDQHIPIVAVSETMQPSTATFQDWQDAQLIALQSALQQA